MNLNQLIGPFDQKHNTLIHLFYVLIISSTLTFLNLGIFSFSFIFGFVLIIKSLSVDISLFKVEGIMILLLLYITIVFLSFLFSPAGITIDSFKLMFQSFYWFIIALILKNIFRYIKEEKLSKILFYCLIILALNRILGINFFGSSQNAVSFSFVILGPLSVFFISNKFKKLFCIVILLTLSLLIESRTGFIIFTVQMILLSLNDNRFIFKKIKSFLFIITFAIILMIMNIKPISQFLGEKISMVEPRLGFALQNLDKLYYLDKSIILRKIQFEKGMQLFNKYPFLGVGMDNFVKTEITNFNPDSEYFSIASPYGLKKNKLNRGSHNSHLSVLTELGIFAFIFIELFFLIKFLTNVRNYNDLSSKFENNLFISFLGLFFYYFMISMHYSTQTWILFGLYSGASTKLNSN